jgi:hypothetical protein
VLLERTRTKGGAGLAGPYEVSELVRQAWRSLMRWWRREAVIRINTRHLDVLTRDQLIEVIELTMGELQRQRE